MIICADDYGIHRSVNDAILILAREKKISAVSVMVKKTSLADALILKDLKVRIGLHLDISFAEALNSPTEINSQISDFKELFGKFPDYIDGHKHCHVYPVISGHLIHILRNSDLPSGFFVRIVLFHPDFFRSAKSFAAVAYLHFLNRLSKAIKRKLAASGIATNRYCWGALNRHATMQEIFEFSYSRSSTEDVLFFHPSLENIDSIDRRTDYEFAIQHFVSN
jgi:hypothetical protein